MLRDYNSEQSSLWKVYTVWEGSGKRQETQTIKSEISPLLMDARKEEWWISDRVWVEF